MPKRRIIPEDPEDACRFHGSLSLNKVKGNFHVSAGKSVPIMRGHAHLTGFMAKEDYNFSHRIDKLSFGDAHGGIIQPLEGEFVVADESIHYH